MGGRLSWRRLLRGVVRVAACGGLPACGSCRFVGPAQAPGPDFLIIGHRGAPYQACENTLESFAQALRLGANALALDVSIPHDEHLVLWHDWVDRVRDRAIHRLRPTGLCDVMTPLRYRVWSRNLDTPFYKQLRAHYPLLLGLSSTVLSSILPLDMSRHGKVERAMSWTKLLTYITGSVDQELLLRNEYLATENRLLRKQIPGRVRLNDGERTILAEIGKRLGKQALAEVATIVKPETILAWHRKLVAQKFDGSQQRKALGRPQVDPALKALVVRLAQENRSWGYDRIVGALRHLGYTISDQTVGNILKRHGIPPAPERRKPRRWQEFISTTKDDA